MGEISIQVGLRPFGTVWYNAGVFRTVRDRLGPFGTSMTGIPLKKVGGYFDGRPKYKTVMRWTTRGVLNRDGEVVKLEVYYEGGRAFVSHEAIEEFRTLLNRRK
jgi:hypothetical protein